MTYRYEFDASKFGDIRLDRSRYEHLQDSLKLLRDELQAWNERAKEHGAAEEPYEAEVADLNRMIAWGDKRLAHLGVTEITERGVSVGSLRYWKAALCLNIRRSEEKHARQSARPAPLAQARKHTLPASLVGCPDFRAT